MDANEFGFSLDRFFSWFKLRLTNLSSLHELPPSNPNDLRSSFSAEQNVLLATGLDALSNYWGRAYAPKRSKHRWRMGEFLRVHGGPCWSLVAGPELRKRAAKEHPEWGPVITSIVGQPEASGRIRTAFDDVALHTFLNRAASVGVQIDEGWARRSLYGEILYEYHRCHWVHELEQSPRLGLEWFSLQEPHYENKLLPDDTGTIVAREHRLVFPHRFLIETYSTALNSFESQCQSDGANPCTGVINVQFGSSQQGRGGASA